MSVPRNQAGCAHSGVHGLVVSGGCNDDCEGAQSGSDTVEKTLDGVTLESLPQMPTLMYRHCLVDLGDGDLFATGLCSRAGRGFGPLVSHLAVQ